ncbi:hypothetical protein Tco_0014050 [Tanacetum coccineum]
MDTLSKVSKYLNDLEEYLDDGDSLEVKKFTFEKSKEELEMFEALEHKSVVVEVEKHRVVVFAKAPPCAYSNPFTRFSLPCEVDGQGTWDAKLDMADLFNYMTKERFDKLGFVRVDYGDYGRNMVKDVCVEVHGFTFLVDFVVIGYANEGEPSVLFGREFLVTSKSKVDFGVGEMRIDLTMLEYERDMDALLMKLVENVEKVGSSNGELIKIGKASRNKGYNFNKLTPPPQPKEKIKEALDRKYKELEESKPILEVLENYMTYRKKLDEVMTGRARLSSDQFGEKEKMRIVEHGLLKKMCDPGNFMHPVRVNGTVEMSALADTRVSVSVLPYSLFKNLGLSDPRPYKSNITMADNTQAKAIGEVRNVRIQIEYQAYLVDFLVLDIPLDKELPLLLGRPFLRTCGAVIDMGCGSMSIDYGVIRRTYFPKPIAKGYLENFEIDEEDDWLSCFEVRRDEDGNPKYGPVAPTFLDIKDDMERALTMEAYFNPFRNINVFKNVIDFLATQSLHQNLLIANYKKRNSIGTIEYHLQQVKNANLKWRELQSMERHAYCERLSKLQGKEIRTPRVVDWSMFYVYSFEETLKELMKFKYIHSDGDVFEDYSWERALSINGDVYLEWCLEFFSMMYFNREVDRTKLMMEKCIWFRLCGHEQVLTLLQFAVLLGLYKESELEHRLFAIHFTRLEIDDKLLNHDAYWQRIGTPTSTNRRTSLIKKPLMRIVHRLIVGSLVHRLSENPCKHARGLKENSLICRGHYVTKIAKSLEYLADEEVSKCSEPIECEKWTSKMLVSELDEENYTFLNETEQRDVWRDSMLMRNNYMIKHSVPILHHLADQANFAYPTYEPPNVPPYPYPYMPYPHCYTHYPDTGNQSFGGEHYGAHGNYYFAVSIVPSSGYEIRGSLGEVYGDDDESDQFVRSKNCMASEDDDDDMED